MAVLQGKGQLDELMNFSLSRRNDIYFQNQLGGARINKDIFYTTIARTSGRNQK